MGKNTFSRLSFQQMNKWHISIKIWQIFIAEVYHHTTFYTKPNWKDVIYRYRLMLKTIGDVVFAPMTGGS